MSVPDPPPAAGPASSAAVRARLASPRLVPWVAVGALIVVATIAVGQLDALIQGGLTYLPFVVLALLAYAGVTRPGARLAAAGWSVCVLASGGGLVGASIVLQAVEELGAAAPANTSRLLLPGVGLGVLLAAACYLPAVRRAAARVLPLDPRSFVHATALSAVVSVTWLAFLPQLLLGEAPLLIPGVLDIDTPSGEAATREQVAELATALVWTVPSALLVVGFPLVRSLEDALRRLSFVVPTRRQVLGGVALAVVLALAMDPFSLLIHVVWDLFGWATSPTESVERLFARDLNPLGAVVIGVTAGLSEELLCRGVLQPRLGLLLPNLFFTALHAPQYNTDGLLTVFVLGLVFGLLRQRTNTTTCVLVHGLYDFIVVMWAVLGVPSLTDLLE